MNHHKNGTIISGSQGSYQYLVSALEDILKGKPKSFEVHHLKMRLIQEGERIGKTISEMKQDCAHFLK